MKSQTFLMFATAVFLLVAAPGMAVDREEQKRQKLDGMLERFPQSDVDGDGVLTEKEMREFRTRFARDFEPLPQDDGRVIPTFHDIQYGPHKRHVLDLYLAPASDAEPAPLVVFFHGGGFTGGDKNNVPDLFVRRAVASGVSVAAANYRFADTHPFPAQFHDGARAVQFLRNGAEKWKLDADRVAAFGESAGAGIALWIGLHDDMADPDSGDPVERRSSRLCAVGFFNGQSTYHPRLMAEWTSPAVLQHPSMLKVWGAKTIEDLENPELEALFLECSPIHHLSADDPPVFMYFRQPDTPLPADAGPNQAGHHPVFGRKVQEKMQSLGVESVLRLPGDRRTGTPHSDMLRFFLRKFAEQGKTSRKPRR